MPVGTLYLALIFLLIFILAGWIVKKEVWWQPWAFILLSSLGFWDIPVMIYPFGIVILWMFLTAFFLEKENSLKIIRKIVFCVFGTMGLTFWLYVPVICNSGINSITYNYYIRPLALKVFLSGLPHVFFSTWGLWQRDVPALINFVLMVGFWTALIFHHRIAIMKVPIVIAGALWCIPFLLFQRVLPYERILFMFLPLYIGIGCAGIGIFFDKVPPARRAVMYAVFAIALCVWQGTHVLNSGSIFSSQETAYCVMQKTLSFI